METLFKFISAICLLVVFLTVGWRLEGHLSLINAVLIQFVAYIIMAISVWFFTTLSGSYGAGIRYIVKKLRNDIEYRNDAKASISGMLLVGALPFFVLSVSFTVGCGYVTYLFAIGSGIGGYFIYRHYFGSTPL